MIKTPLGATRSWNVPGLPVDCDSGYTPWHLPDRFTHNIYRRLQTVLYE
jgi:hypothetical protein